ncbi:MAG: PSD1 and planctomycete cytochrome C domain-containing protein [Bryobacteraceae bacterium]
MLLRAAYLLAIAAALPGADPAEFFETRVRPVLATNCYSCHAATKLGGLEVTSREALLNGGKSGPAIVPGKPAESLLLQAISYSHTRLKMPPSGRLREAEISALEQWIRDGAVWPQGKATIKSKGITAEQRAFWSFQPVRKPAIPSTRDDSWPKTAVDRFILARLEQKGLTPTAEADKRTLIRRASFDLIGLPPAPSEVAAFLADTSPEAFTRVVDRLLDSPHYGERWGRYWLDIARFGDEKLASTRDEPYANAFRYRDWVVRAFNEDMPYADFVKAQIAGDLMEVPDRSRYLPGLGFYGLSPEFQDDRVDVTTRGFLGLTVACAQCHDHKYDPIPTTDFYALQGVFASSKLHEYPLAAEPVVAEWEKRKAELDGLEKELKEFLKRETAQVGEILAGNISAYLMAASRVLLARPPQQGLDEETVQRFVTYLRSPREHPFLKTWDALIQRGAPENELQKEADDFQTLALAVIREKRALDAQQGQALEPAKAILWKDLYFSNPRPDLPYRPPPGLLYNGEINQYPGSERDVIRFLDGDRRRHVDRLTADIDRLRSALPPKYPLLHGIAEDKPQNIKVHIGGSAENLGAETPRRFLTILSRGEPKAFSKGSGRLELAEAIASAENPLTARVMVNRVWHYHFGEGLVRTPGNFGQLGERPTHPELLDYLAARFIENRWSLKALHREIMLSAVYRSSSAPSARQAAVDSDNKLLWRTHRRRLDAEAIRDSLLFIAGRLDLTAGGPPVWLTENFATKKGPDGEADKYSQAAEWVTGLKSRRTIYGYVARRRPDQTMALFDFPSPSSTSDRRFTTSTPLQQLFFLNSDFVARQAEGLVSRVKTGGDPAAGIRRVYETLFSREPLPDEIDKGRRFLSSGGDRWTDYVQVLLASNEFLFVR